ncbi:MAG: hypothetical protein Q9M29_07935 [Mariprofundaceae bacterium]|nr:hypothetical protein [Mariprofundaceae bacterium]
MMFQTLDGLQVPTLTVEQMRDAAYEKMGIRMQSPFAGAPYIRLHVRRKTSPVIPGMPL